MAAPNGAWASPGAVAEPTLSTEPRAVPVVGGQPVAEGRWHDAGGMLGRRGTPSCTGVLVAPTVVLTAAHCIGGIRSVLFGVNDYTKEGEEIAVSQQIAYPNWNGSYDIGVLVLAQPATTEPRVIASGCIRDKAIKNGAQVAIVGYGAIDAYGNEYGTELREAITTVTDFDCSSVERGCVASVSPGGEIGAGGMGIDSCFGDSGGPLYLLTEHGDFLVGITSRAWDDAGLPCSEGGIYVRPDAVIDWIEGETGVDLPEPTCNIAPEPTATALEVESGATESAAVTANDPDTADTHGYSIATAPEHGQASVDADGIVTYTADHDYVGPDMLVVTVVDTGVPALSGQVVVAITVVEPPGGCGCRTGSGNAGGLLLLLGAAMWAARRRRRL